MIANLRYHSSYTFSNFLLLHVACFVMAIFIYIKQLATHSDYELAFVNTGEIINYTYNRYVGGGIP